MSLVHVQASRSIFQLEGWLLNLDYFQCVCPLLYGPHFHMIIFIGRIQTFSTSRAIPDILVDQ